MSTSSIVLQTFLASAPVGLLFIVLHLWKKGRDEKIRAQRGKEVRQRAEVSRFHLYRAYASRSETGKWAIRKWGYSGLGDPYLTDGKQFDTQAAAWEYVYNNLPKEARSRV